MGKGAEAIGVALGAQHVIELESTNAGLQRKGGSPLSGTLYVATPQLLGVFGITSSELDSNARHP